MWLVAFRLFWFETLGGVNSKHFLWAASPTNTHSHSHTHTHTHIHSVSLFWNVYPELGMYKTDPHMGPDNFLQAILVHFRCCANTFWEALFFAWENAHCILCVQRWHTNFIRLYIFFNKIFYCCSITLVCIFSPPLYPTPAKPISLPCFHPPSWFCPCVLYSSSWKPFSPLSLPRSPLCVSSVALIINQIF